MFSLVWGPPGTASDTGIRVVLHMAEATKKDPTDLKKIKHRERKTVTMSALKNTHTHTNFNSQHILNLPQGKKCITEMFKAVGFVHSFS